MTRILYKKIKYCAACPYYYQIEGTHYCSLQLEKTRPMSISRNCPLPEEEEN